MTQQAPDWSSIEVIAFLNNSISTMLFKADMERRNLPLEKAAVILGRPIEPEWIERCGYVLKYPGKPSNSLFGQRHFISYYRKAAAAVREAIEAGSASEFYIVNNDNLITSHMLSAAGHEPRYMVTVVAEGLMNFQDISHGNRAGWRWRTKPWLARLLQLDYHQPVSHLSGAFEPQVDRIVSFATQGLKAPPEKTECIEFRSEKETARTNPRWALIPLTGLAQWMPRESAEEFARAFHGWLVEQDFERLLVKPHPHSDAGPLGSLLPPHELLGDLRSLEEMAADLEAGTIIGTCCTALATLKLMRPELRCVDFGADYYQIHAYGGDRSVETFLRGVGVEVIPYDPGKQQCRAH